MEWITPVKNKFSDLSLFKKYKFSLVAIVGIILLLFILISFSIINNKKYLFYSLLGLFLIIGFSLYMWFELERDVFIYGYVPIAGFILFVVILIFLYIKFRLWE